MPTIHEEVRIAAAADAVWDAARDYGALHTRLVPGFVTGVVVEPGTPPVRIVTFASGMVLREAIIDIDDARRRIAWTIESDNVRHHNGVLQIFEDGEGSCRVTWTADVLPTALAAQFQPAMAGGLQAMMRVFEG